MINNVKLTNELPNTSHYQINNKKNFNFRGLIQNTKKEETLSFITSGTDIKSTISQFIPPMVKARFKKFIDLIKDKTNQKTKAPPKKQIIPKDLKNTSGSIKHKNLSDKEIQKKVQTLYDEIFDKLKVPKNQRPVLEIKKENKHQGGSYNQGNHTLSINLESYKSGEFELEDIIAHEATHCREALLRAGIPKARVEKIVKEQLLSRIQNGESEKILIKTSFLGADMMKPPKMSQKMKSEFSKFAIDNLYTLRNKPFHNYYDQLALKGTKCESPAKLATTAKNTKDILDKIRTLLNDNPEFIKQYKDSEEAFEALVKYSVSHHTRYERFTYTTINKAPYYTKIPVEELKGDKLLQAEKSLVDYISTSEGNDIISGTENIYKSFNQYQFSPEEVLSQKNGNEFLIEKMTAKINQMKKNGELDSNNEKAMLKVIEKSKTVIEYKMKGLKYYELYTKMINNPNDNDLAHKVKILENELKLLNEKITRIDY